MSELSGATAHVTGSALAVHHELSPDVYPDLFNHAFHFANGPLASWCEGSRSWQLHCYGGPGCGKTTFATVAAAHLRKNSDFSVATVFIREDVVANGLFFLEDLLWSIYQQTLPPHNEDTIQASSLFGSLCGEGINSQDRIAIIRQALSNGFSSKGSIPFLVLDGYDKLNDSLQYIVDRELRSLQQNGLRIMITRRVAIFESHPNSCCDGKPNDEEFCDEDYMKLYWQCQTCLRPDSTFMLCYSCMNAGQKCRDRDCLDPHFTEPYNHVSFHVRSLLNIRKFVLQDLHREYGEHLISDSLREIVAGHVANSANGNITIAKLYLDEVYNMEVAKLSSIQERVFDRLPRSVVLFFQQEVKRILNQPKPVRDLTLLAIAAAAEHLNGISLDIFHDRMVIGMAKLPHVGKWSHRTLEHVLRAANGLIMEQGNQSGDIALFDQGFRDFVAENYSDELFWASEQLRSDEITPFDSDAPRPGIVDSPQILNHSLGNTVTNNLSSRSQTLDLTIKDFTKPPSSLSTLQGARKAETFGLGISGKGYVMSPPRMHSDERLSSSKLASADLVNDSHYDNIVSNSTTSKSKDRLCSFCKNFIFESRRASGHHQVSLSNLKTSKEIHCVICSLLHSDFQQSNDSEKNNWKWPLHRWSLRSNSSWIILSFRPLQVVQFPTRNFIIFSKGDSYEVPTEARLGDSTDPRDNGGHQIQQWLHICNTEHQSCYKPSKSTFLPTRLLDLNTGNPNTILLVDTRASNIKGPYCTLSHSWGLKSFMTLQTENLARFLLNGINISELSTNFQHAISLARFIGVRYLWIDSLCIIQSAIGGDFKNEGDLMHKVYRNSFCNLVAADTKDCTSGLFRRRDPVEVLPVGYVGDGKTALFGSKEWTIASEGMWDNELLGTNIYTRGWVFQERMLSPRILHFTRNQIFWDCGTISACEAFPLGLPLALDNTAATDRHWRGRLQEALAPQSGVNDDSLETMWKSAVYQYSSCDLTNQSDKLVAVWSIAKLVRDALSQALGAGMWGERLEEQLAWKVEDLEKAQRAPELQLDIPSWSWASVKGAVLLPDRYCDRAYRITDHDDKSISFKLKENFVCPQGKLAHSSRRSQASGVGLREWLEGKSKSVIDLESIHPDSPRDKVRDTDGGDKQPELNSKSIAICGHIETGLVLKGSESNSYILHAKDLDSNDILVDAFPDEMPKSNSERCLFMVLAASKTFVDSSPMIGTECQDDKAAEFAYSGVGILLARTDSLPSQYSQTLGQLRKEYALENMRQGCDAKEKKWKLQGIEKEIQCVQKLLSLPVEEMHYRRTGSFEFHGLNEKYYLGLKGNLPVKFWLD